MQICQTDLVYLLIDMPCIRSNKWTFFISKSVFTRTCWPLMLLVAFVRLSEADKRRWPFNLLLRYFFPNNAITLDSTVAFTYIVWVRSNYIVSLSTSKCCLNAASVAENYKIKSKSLCWHAHWHWIFIFLYPSLMHIPDVISPLEHNWIPVTCIKELSHHLVKGWAMFQWQANWFSDRGG